MKDRHWELVSQRIPVCSPVSLPEIGQEILVHTPKTEPPIGETAHAKLMVQILPTGTSLGPMEEALVAGVMAVTCLHLWLLLSGTVRPQAQTPLTQEAPDHLPGWDFLLNAIPFLTHFITRALILPFIVTCSVIILPCGRYCSSSEPGRQRPCLHGAYILVRGQN